MISTGHRAYSKDRAIDPWKPSKPYRQTDLETLAIPRRPCKLVSGFRQATVYWGKQILMLITPVGRPLKANKLP